MSWLTILLWLLQTIGPYLLELIIEWLKNNKNMLGMIPDQVQYEKAMQSLPANVSVPQRQFRLAKKLVMKHSDKMPQIMERIERAKGRMGDISQR